MADNAGMLVTNVKKIIIAKIGRKMDNRWQLLMHLPSNATIVLTWERNDADEMTA